jgi:hypothetical protein
MTPCIVYSRESLTTVESLFKYFWRTSSALLKPKIDCTFTTAHQEHFQRVKNSGCLRLIFYTPLSMIAGSRFLDISNRNTVTLRKFGKIRNRFLAYLLDQDNSFNRKNGNQKSRWIVPLLTTGNKPTDVIMSALTAEDRKINYTSH